jgi:hypothetical protein
MLIRLQNALISSMQLVYETEARTKSGTWQSSGVDVAGTTLTSNWQLSSGWLVHNCSFTVAASTPCTENVTMPHEELLS